MRCVCAGRPRWKGRHLSPGKINFRVNDTTRYTLVKTRHSRVPTYLQRETDTADWLTPSFTLPCPKNGGVYPAASTLPRLLFSRTVPRFSEMYPDLAESGTLTSTIFSAGITFRSQQRRPKPKSFRLANSIASLGGWSAPTKEHQNINSSISKHTMAYHQKSFQSNSDLIHEFCI